MRRKKAGGSVLSDNLREKLMRAWRRFIVQREPEFIFIVQGIRARTPDPVLQNYL